MPAQCAIRQRPDPGALSARQFVGEDLGERVIEARTLAEHAVHGQSRERPRARAIVVARARRFTTRPMPTSASGARRHRPRVFPASG